MLDRGFSYFRNFYSGYSEGGLHNERTESFRRRSGRDYLVMENEEDGRYLIFNLDGSLAGSCDEGELQSALDNMLKTG